MYKKIGCICATLLTLLGASAAHAEGFDVQSFYPILGSQGVFSVESAKTLGHLDYDVKVFVDYANTPLKYQTFNGDAKLEHLTTLTLSGAVGLLDFLEVGVSLPIVVQESFNQTYKDTASLANVPGDTGYVGDMQVRAKGTIVKDINGFSLGAGAIFSIPTGKESAMLGDTQFWGRPYVAATYEIGPVELMANAGFTFRKKAQYLDYTSHHGFNYGLGVNYHAIENWLDVKGEIFGETPMSSKAQNSNHQAAEFLLGALVMTPIGLNVTVGAGAGIGSGVKNPKYRLLLGLEYHPQRTDSDGDGIYDRDDYCPDIAGTEEFEGCPAPDTDQDGWCDAWISSPDVAAHFSCSMTDKCPEIAGLAEFEGCPNPDTDGDGVCDAWVAENQDELQLSLDCSGVDYCPQTVGTAEFEGCPIPDTDGDGWCDAWIQDEKTAEKFECKMSDMCPETAGEDDFKGCPNADSDGDGLCAPFVEQLGLYELYFCSGVDSCPDAPEDFDNFEDEDGCPDPDNDHDGICDPWVSEMGLLDKYMDVCRGADLCPDEPEIINGYQDDDGCPDKGKQIVFVHEDKIEIKDKIYFDNNKASIKKKSDSLLDQLAQTILANPDIQHLTIEGHTDDTGKYEHNLNLSKARAQSVMDALVQRGVAESRLSSVGYGPDRPLDPAKTKKARALNRRVEFVITERQK